MPIISHDALQSLANLSPSPETDFKLMQAALKLGRAGLGLTAPNPSVGALGYRDGAVVGYGLTAKGGRPHGEVLALQMAADKTSGKTKGATLYVTLEPCCHHGHTLPCVDAIVNAGIKRVVCALEDPDPRVSGKGFAHLRAKGIEVVVGIGANEARRDHLGHALRIFEQRPLITLKLALTADGYAAGDTHDGRLFITGAVAGERTHLLRASHDAIMCGLGTVIEDDPLLNIRLPEFSQGDDKRLPTRIVLDSQLKIPLRSRLVMTARQQPVIVLCSHQASDENAAQLELAGVSVLRVGSDLAGRVDIKAALAELSRVGITRILCEGGPTLATTLVRAGLTDEVLLMVSPRPLGREGRLGLLPEARAILEHEPWFERLPDEVLGHDTLYSYRKCGNF